MIIAGYQTNVVNVLSLPASVDFAITRGKSKINVNCSIGMKSSPLFKIQSTKTLKIYSSTVKWSSHFHVRMYVSCFFLFFWRRKRWSRYRTDLRRLRKTDRRRHNIESDNEIRHENDAIQAHDDLTNSWMEFNQNGIIYRRLQVYDINRRKKEWKEKM